jgi:CheY-like chemotaxis protein
MMPKMDGTDVCRPSQQPRTSSPPSMRGPTSI